MHSGNEGQQPHSASCPPFLALLSSSPLRSSAVIGDNIQVLSCAPDSVLLLTECPQAPASVGHQAIFYNLVSSKDVQVPGPNRV